MAAPSPAPPPLRFSAAPALRAARAAVAGPLQRGAAALGARAGERAADLRAAAQARDADAPWLDRALALVRDFIARRGLVVFGGLAIDAALRARGARLYPDGERPDYDCLSPRAVDDAYDLADELRAAGFVGVSAVRAIHVQTMRVRVDFVFVADLGHAPAAVFARLPTLAWRGLRVAHPDFQRMDMHLAFCFPFSNPPQEDVFHRWGKDLRRLGLLAQHYPVEAQAPAPRSAAEAPAKAAPLVTARLAAPIADGGAAPVALHGFAAYAALRAALDEAAEALGAPPPALAAPRLALEFPDERTVRVAAPAGGAVHLASPAPEAVAGPGARWRDPYMDLCPETAEAGPLVVWSTRGRLLAAGAVRAAVGGAARTVRTATPAYLLLFFALEAFRAEDEAARAVYRAYYAHTLAVLAAAEALFAALPAPASEVAALFAASPFAPTVRPLGAENLSPAYAVRLAAYAEKAGDPPPAALAALGLDAAALAALPRNYYPDSPGRRGARPPPYDYDACALFRRAGALRSAPPPPQ